MSNAAEFFSKLMPISYTGENLRDILLSGYAPNFWQDFKTLIIYALISLVIATGIFLLKGGLNFVWRVDSLPAFFQIAVLNQHYKRNPACNF